MKPFLFLIYLLAVAASGKAQPWPGEDSAYVHVVTERADKIVKTLVLANASAAGHVRDIIAYQYRSLNALHRERDRKLKEARNQKASDAQALADTIRKIEQEAAGKLDRLHQAYLALLETELTVRQIEQVKDGMTYGVLPITYRGYLDMIPRLTEEQKAQIMAWLIEARERAMDAESSEKKHQWFGKYKGKINNYLSAAGYDLKKEGIEWEKRRALQSRAE
jgi:hypothetical protein